MFTGQGRHLSPKLHPTPGCRRAQNHPQNKGGTEHPATEATQAPASPPHSYRGKGHPQ